MRKHNYLVGYRGRKECVYGLKNSSGLSGSSDYLGPLTFHQAKKLMKSINLCNKKCGLKGRVVIFKLVEIKGGEKKE